MMMDLRGKKPTEEVGEYFSTSVFRWGTMLGVLRAVAPEIVTEERVKDFSVNDGHGLDAEESKRLGDALAKALDSPDGLQFAKPVPSPRGDALLGWLGAGPADYSLDSQVIRRLQELVPFLRSCGGFEIN